MGKIKKKQFCSPYPAFNKLPQARITNYGFKTFSKNYQFISNVVVLKNDDISFSAHKFTDAMVKKSKILLKHSRVIFQILFKTMFESDI